MQTNTLTHTTFWCHTLLLFNYKNTVSSGYPGNISLLSFFLNIKLTMSLQATVAIQIKFLAFKQRLRSTCLCIQVYWLKVISVPVYVCAGALHWSPLRITASGKYSAALALIFHITSFRHLLSAIHGPFEVRTKRMANRNAFFTFSLQAKLSLSVSVSLLLQDPSLNTLWLSLLLPPHSFSTKSSLISTSKYSGTRMRRVEDRTLA